MKNKVEIKIEKGNYHESVKGGCAYTSVGFSGKTYGSGSPCDTEEEVQQAIKRCMDTIKKEGDIPVIKDERIKVVQMTL